MTDPTPDYLALAERLGKHEYFQSGHPVVTEDLLREAVSALRIADKTINELREAVKGAEYMEGIALADAKEYEEWWNAATALNDRLREALGWFVNPTRPFTVMHDGTCRKPLHGGCTCGLAAFTVARDSARSLLSEKGEDGPHDHDDLKVIALREALRRARIWLDLGLPLEARKVIVAAEASSTEPSSSTAAQWWMNDDGSPPAAQQEGE